MQDCHLFLEMFSTHACLMAQIFWQLEFIASLLVTLIETKQDCKLDIQHIHHLVNFTSFFCQYFFAKRYKHKRQVKKKSFNKHFLTKKLLEKCWCNWHQDTMSEPCSLFKLWCLLTLFSSNICTWIRTRCWNIDLR